MEALTFGSLFAGIGGFDLGLERAGMVCKWQVEIDPYCWKVLHDRWPNVPKWDDVRTFPPDFSNYWNVDLICGGFPCQDISACNYQGEGLDGERSGLWFQFERILRIFRPRFAIVENVTALAFRGLGRVLSDLSTLGFDAEWQVIPASEVAAPHYRERIFIVAYRPGERQFAREVYAQRPFETASEKQEARLRLWPGQCEPSPALPDRIRWVPDRELCRMVDGLPSELDLARIKSLGNSIVPQVAEYIGRQLLASLNPTTP